MGWAWQNGAMTENGGKVRHKRGHNAIMTGLAMLVFSAPFILGSWGNDGPSGFPVLVAFAGLITLIVGFGVRREQSVSSPS